MYFNPIEISFVYNLYGPCKFWKFGRLNGKILKSRTELFELDQLWGHLLIGARQIKSW